MDSIAREGSIEERIEERSDGARRSARGPRRAFFITSALLFAAAASGTIRWATSMSNMGGMPMPGGWSMSMVWMRMPDQNWPGVAAAFLGMWTVMMIAMMLPSLVPALWRYIATAGSSDRLAALIGAGYFSVWVALGVAVFVLGIVLAALEMREPELARAVPIMAGAIVLAAGLLQFTLWKAHHLALCREVPCRGRALPSKAIHAWRCGLRLGLHCCLCSVGSTAVLLVVGMMDLRAMAAVTAAITLERLAPAGQRVVWAIGAVAVGAGSLLIISAA